MSRSENGSGIRGLIEKEIDHILLGEMVGGQTSQSDEKS